MTSYSEAREVMLRSYLSSVGLVQTVDQSVINQIFATIFELVKLAGMFDPGAIKTWINNSANLVASMLMVVDGRSMSRFTNIVKLRDQYLSSTNGHDLKILNAAVTMIIDRVKAQNIADEVENSGQSCVVTDVNKLSTQLVVNNQTSSCSSANVCLKSAIKSPSLDGDVTRPINLTGGAKVVTWSGLGSIDHDKVRVSKTEASLRRKKERNNKNVGKCAKRKKLIRSVDGTGVENASKKRQKSK